MALFRGQILFVDFVSDLGAQAKLQWTRRRRWQLDSFNECEAYRKLQLHQERQDSII